jgi:L-seryl-tRNA(Ser) seleniumtransferase
VNESPFRRLPPVGAVLDRPELAEFHESRGRQAVLLAVRCALEEAREAIARGDADDADDHRRLAIRAVDFLSADRHSLRPVLNASGVLLHTGLGRAPLAAEAVEAVARVARGYCNLELDLETGDRGRRTTAVEELLCRLTGAEAATVVNNNAAATILALRGLALDREVVVSRGQLVEIGGGFRLPEIFEVSGARLREVGTTNKTRLDDYEQAIGLDTAALMRVHSSNFRIVGFTESVDIADIAALAHSRGLVAIDDIGSGALAADRPATLSDEPNLADSLASGADLVLCSGDKLLGGPQCGLLVGGQEVIARLCADPLMRALRVDKMTLAALEATLRLALDPAVAARSIPLWKFLSASSESLKSRAQRLADRLRAGHGVAATVGPTASLLGGGSAPDCPLESFAVILSPPFPAAVANEQDLARRLRAGDPPMIARLQSGSLLLDLRAIDETNDDLVFACLARVFQSAASASG